MQPEMAMPLDRYAGLVGAVDRRLARLAHASLIPPYASRSTEIVALAGIASAARDQDWLFWGPSVCAPALLRGLGAADLFEQALYASRAVDFAKRRIVICSQGPAARLPHAAGLAWAARKDGVVAFVELSDGAIADGDVHVGFNFAAVLRAPVVFAVRTSGVTPVAERADGYGMAVATVEATSPHEVREAMLAAARQARSGGGPTLVAIRTGTPMDEARIIEHEADIDAALARAEMAQGAISNGDPQR